MKEIWLDIISFEGLYQVSSRGRVKSLAREVLYPGGYYSKQEKIMKLNYKPDGYVNIGLSKNNNNRYFRVHRLVLKTFNLVEGMEDLQVNHINFNKSDNRLSNLEWCTPLENTQHAIKYNHRGNQKGVNNPQAKLKPKDVLEIVNLKENKILSERAIAMRFNVCRKTVNNIWHGKVWSHITGIEKCND